MQTTFKRQQDVQAAWYQVDADGEIVGRLAVRIARVLRGKHRADFTPHVDGGDFVIVTNAAGVRLTGLKEQQKVYRHHTGYVGGLKEVPFLRQRNRRPEEIVRRAVRGMLPKNALGRQMLKKLKIFRGAEHPHAAQQPQPLP